MENFKITVIYDNNTLSDKLKPEWGFACLVEGAEKNILFDTGGDGAVLMSNISELGINPGDIDLVVLSHAHWDHVGGLADFLKKNGDVTVYPLKSFSGQIKSITDKAGVRIIDVSGPMEICAGVFSTGTMGTDIEEQALILKTDSGGIVITGCAHPGVVEMTQKAKEIIGDDILLVMGGFHLHNHSDSAIKSIIKEFHEMGVKYAAPCHCSGENARKLFKKDYQDNFIDIGAGKIILPEELRK